MNKTLPYKNMKRIKELEIKISSLEDRLTFIDKELKSKLNVQSE